MRSHSLLPLLLGAVLIAALLPASASATDVDGGNDCPRTGSDWGDAPEGVMAYPAGTIGAFPSCLAPGPVGTTQHCSGAGAPPGPAGWVRHAVSAGGRYWLGCSGTPASPAGVDAETDGKAGCGLTPDCIEHAFGAFDIGQDDCFNGSDAGLLAPNSVPACGLVSVNLALWNCGSTRIVYLNVCVDFNHDGDWNDTTPCSAFICASEWAIENQPLLVGAGCNALTSSQFRVGADPGPAWMRITVTDDPVPPDFTWNGSASAPSGQFAGGETEDYPVMLDVPVPSPGSSWGSLKTLYR